MLDIDYIKLTDYLSSSGPDDLFFLGAARACRYACDGASTTLDFSGPKIHGAERIDRIDNGLYLNVAQFSCLTDVTYPFLYDVEDIVSIQLRLEGTSYDMEGDKRILARRPGSVHVILSEKGARRLTYTQRRSNIVDISLTMTVDMLRGYTGISVDAAAFFFNEYIGARSDRSFFTGFAMTRQMTDICNDLLKPPYDGAISRLYVRAKTLELICALAACLVELQQKPSKRSRAAMRRLEKLQEAKAIIAKDFEAYTDAADLARRVGMSRTSLVCGFRDAFQESIGTYMKRQRMIAAQDMLRRGGVPVAEVARRVGFKTSSGFIAVYKSYFGVTPGACQRAALAGQPAESQSVSPRRLRHTH